MVFAGNISSSNPEMVYSPFSYVKYELTREDRPPALS
jgi:hypothetical protein